MSWCSNSKGSRNGLRRRVCRTTSCDCSRTPAPHWVQVVGGWTYHQFREKRLPTLAELNAATGDVPCFVMHMYDRAQVNRAGLRVLGWTKDTPDPFGGVMARDATGAPTGLVITTTSLVSLLGVFSTLTLQLVPAYRLHERIWRSDTDTCLAEMEANIAAHRHFEFWWYPPRDFAEQKTLQPTDA